MNRSTAQPPRPLHRRPDGASALPSSRPRVERWGLIAVGLGSLAWLAGCPASTSANSDDDLSRHVAMELEEINKELARPEAMTLTYEARQDLQDGQEARPVRIRMELTCELEWLPPGEGVSAAQMTCVPPGPGQLHAMAAEGMRATILRGVDGYLVRPGFTDARGKELDALWDRERPSAAALFIPDALQAPRRDGFRGKDIRCERTMARMPVPLPGGELPARCVEIACEAALRTRDVWCLNPDGLPLLVASDGEGTQISHLSAWLQTTRPGRIAPQEEAR